MEMAPQVPLAYLDQVVWQGRMGGRVTRALQAPRGTKAEMGFRGRPERKET